MRPRIHENDNAGGMLGGAFAVKGVGNTRRFENHINILHLLDGLIRRPWQLQGDVYPLALIHNPPAKLPSDTTSVNNHEISV